MQADSLYKSQVMQSTYRVHGQAYKELYEAAICHGFDYLCQELYSVFLAESRCSRQRSDRRQCIKRVDALANTHAIDTDGLLINEPPLPDINTAQKEVTDYVSGAKNKLSFDSLFVATIEAINTAGTTSSTLGQYNRVCRIIRSMLVIRGISDYDYAVLQNLNDENDHLLASGERAEWKWKIIKRTLRIMEDVALTGEFHWHTYHSKDILPYPGMEEMRNSYAKTLIDRQLEKSTRDLHDYVFRKIIELGSISSPEKLRGIDKNDVISICKSLSSILSPNSRMTVFPIIRTILEYMYDTGCLQHRLSGCVITTCDNKNNTAAYIPLEQEAALLECAQQATRLRDRAIILLGYKLALRDVDICNLRLSDIDWKHDCINVIQKKTGIPLSLPLLDDVGNALMEYILHERPSKSNSQHVFLRSVEPYAKLSSVYNIVRQIQEKAGVVSANGNKKGSHLFRYSLAFRLQKAKVPHHTITDVLGHYSKESDKPYLSMDALMLKKCSLGLDLIGVKKWIQ